MHKYLITSLMSRLVWTGEDFGFEVQGGDEGVMEEVVKVSFILCFVIKSIFLIAVR